MRLFFLAPFRQLVSRSLLLREIQSRPDLGLGGDEAFDHAQVKGKIGCFSAPPEKHQIVRHAE